MNDYTSQNSPSSKYFKPTYIVRLSTQSFYFAPAGTRRPNTPLYWCSTTVAPMRSLERHLQSQCTLSACCLSCTTQASPKTYFGITELGFRSYLERAFISNSRADLQFLLSYLRALLQPMDEVHPLPSQQERATWRSILTSSL